MNAKTSQPHPRPAPAPVLLALALAALTLATLWPVTTAAYLNFDDPDYVSENFHVLAGLSWAGVRWAFTAVCASNWHPLTWLAHMADVSLFGPGPRAAHTVNLLLHTANAALVFAVLRRLTAATWRSLFVAALFALHPLHVESVAWVSERKDVLSTFFGLATIWFYVGHAEKAEIKSRRPLPFEFQLSTFNFQLSLLCFALGLLAKPMLVTLPCVLLLLDFWPLRRRQLFREKIPFFALSAASCMATVVAQQNALQSLTGFPFPVRVGNAAVAYARYLGKTFWPTDLALPYPHPGAWPLTIIFAATALLLAVSAAVFQHRHTRPYLAVGWCWFLGTLVPVIGLVQVGGQSMADRYTYLPLLGIFIALAWGAGELVARWEKFRWPVIAVAALAVVTCAQLTHAQAARWHDSGTLFAHAAAVTPNNDLALSNLGNHQLLTGKIDEAIVSFHRALGMMGGLAQSPEKLVAALADESGADDPAAAEARRILGVTDPKKNTTTAEILNNLGTCHARQGRTNVAMQHYRAVLQLKPAHALALYNLAFELTEQKHFPEAFVLYARALAARPDDPRLRNGLGSAYFAADQIENAIREYATALQLAPTDAPSHRNLGLALTARGDVRGAIAQFETALHLDPSLAETHNNLGAALMQVGDYPNAIAHFQKILRVAPDHARAQGNLGVLLAAQGNFTAAEIHLREAVRLEPTNVNARFNLGNVLASQKKFTDAVTHYTEFVRAVPDHAAARCNLGGALAELGRRDEALAQFRAALQLDPGNTTARAQLRQLGVATP